MNQKPFIEAYTKYTWRCPNCKEYNDNAENDGDGFVTPLKCEDCGAEFNDYETNI